MRTLSRVRARQRRKLALSVKPAKPRRRSGQRRAASEWLRALAGIAVTGALYAELGGQGLRYLLYFGGLLLALGLLYSLLGPRSVEAVRSAGPAYPVAGGAVEIKVELRFRTPLPLFWLVYTDQWNGLRHRELLFPGFRRRLTFRYRLENVPRGSYRLHHSGIVWGDPAGLFTSGKELTGTAGFKVRPVPLRLEASSGWSIPAGGGPQFASPDRDGTETGDKRAYVPGDPANRIDWKSSARTGTLYSRVQNGERGRMICILLDNGAKSYTPPASKLGPRSGTGAPDQAFERAVSAAFGLLLDAERTGAYAQLFTGGWPEGGAKHEGLGIIPLSTIDLLTEIAPEGARRVPRLMEDAAHHWIPGMTAAVITGALDSDLAQAAARLLMQGVKVEVYYSWDQDAPGMKGSVGNSLTKLGARLYRLDNPLFAGGTSTYAAQAADGKHAAR